MNTERLTTPDTLAVSLEEAKLHCRVDLSEDDAAITRMIRAATREAEELGQLALINQTIRVTLTAWPKSGRLPLPIGPVQDGAVVTVTTDGAPLTGFTVRTGRRPALELTDYLGSAVIEYQAGFGHDASAVPEDLALAILDQVVLSYDNRGGLDDKLPSVSPSMARAVARHRGVRL
ncbi:head-tail connector protein [Rhodovulum sulfidophilum]|uniref:head-tail connector protein n=1 Tax=Rhodovulum sulfidophilum TaxID=35806 RepID=UPI0009516DC9|nr:head-tail connector protein [Rhodovulum sulfidophilum]OLS50588.1 hypothetical protein BV392_00265 [Rhodovulum sulfidophilum]